MGLGERRRLRKGLIHAINVQSPFPKGNTCRLRELVSQLKYPYLL